MMKMMMMVTMMMGDILIAWICDFIETGVVTQRVIKGHQIAL